MTIVAPSQQADTVLARDYERLKPDILRTVRGKLASSGVRFTLGRGTTAEACDRAAVIFGEIVARMRK